MIYFLNYFKDKGEIIWDERKEIIIEKIFDLD